MGVDSPNVPFAFDGDGIADNNKLHMWSNIAEWEFLLNVNVHPATPILTLLIVPTMAISNVPVKLKPNVHKNVEEGGNQM